ncbi:hypothetical protein PspLS_08870 [Pyricularia sp. CBS 133598]|nr:hypothetical protein PspLS_08870 [Pyricularia sp. CBS 133598]
MSRCGLRAIDVSDVPTVKWPRYPYAVLLRIFGSRISGVDGSSLRAPRGLASVCGRQMPTSMITRITLCLPIEAI